MRIRFQRIIQISVIFYSIILLENCNPVGVSSNEELIETIDSSKFLYLDTLQSVLTWVRKNTDSIDDGKILFSEGYLYPKNDSVLIGYLTLQENQKNFSNSNNSFKPTNLSINNIYKSDTIEFGKIDSSFFIKSPNAILNASLSFKDLKLDISCPAQFTLSDSSFVLNAKFSFDSTWSDEIRNNTKWFFGMHTKGGINLD